MNEYITYLLELLAPLSDVRAKKMFGGYGIYRNDLMFGLVADDTLYLKADDKNRPDFEAKNLDPFTYHKKGKAYSMSYYCAPEDVLENSEQLCSWAEKAYAAAVRAAAQKTRSKR